MRRLIFAVLFFGILAVPFARANCPAFSDCPIDGIGGYPTGNYRWQGSREFEQFEHALVNGGRHVWWVQCD
jgi:hypothetical protein